MDDKNKLDVQSIMVWTQLADNGYLDKISSRWFDSINRLSNKI